MDFSGKRGSYRLVAAAWLVGLLLLSFLPAQWKVVLHTRGRLHDVAHLLVFGMLAWLMTRAARTREREVGALLLAAAIGFAVELGQDLVFWLHIGVHAPVEWGDVLLDLMAVVLAGIIALGILPDPRKAGVPSRGLRNADLRRRA